MEQNALKWCKKYKNLSLRDKELLTRSIKCLEDNIVASNNKIFKNRKAIVPSKNTYQGVWNWDSAFIALAVSRYDYDLALNQIDFFFEKQDKRGMFPDAILLNNKVYDLTSKPPIFPSVLMVMNKRKKLPNLEYYYQKFVLNEQFWCKYRKAGELFHYDAFTLNKYYYRDCKNESGWDTSVRWDNGAECLWAVDLNCYMVDFYNSLIYFAKQLNLKEDIKVWQTKRRNLIKNIELNLWDNDMQFYCDYDFDKKCSTKILSPAGFMPLTIKIASKEHAEKCYLIAKDEKYFYPLMPTVSYDNNSYSSSDYWRGPSWINTFYYAILGLKNYNYLDLAEKYKNNMLDMCFNEKSGIYEYYDSKTGKGLGAKQFSWSSAFIIEAILS